MLEVFTSPTPNENVNYDDETKDNISLLLDKVSQLDQNYSILRRIGHGTFSSVYLGKTKAKIESNQRKYFAIKHIIPTCHPSRIYMELKCLKQIGGVDNVIEAVSCIRQMNHIVIIMPYFHHDDFKNYVGKLPLDELRNYIKNLLLAVKRVHSFNIIHRDIKPANFLYNRKHRRFALVDFGLAEDLEEKKNGKNKSNKITPVSKYVSPKIIETPHLKPSKTVKRKLSVLGTPDGLGSLSKRPRQLSPPGASPKSILSATSTRINQAIRRSPRKLPSTMANQSMSKKENFLSPSNTKRQSIDLSPELGKHIARLADNKKALDNLSPLMDSPSKHTRNAEQKNQKQTPSNTTKETISSNASQEFLKSIVCGDSTSVPSLGARVLTHRSNPSTNLTTTSTAGSSAVNTSKNQDDTKYKTSRSSSQQSSCHCYGTSRICKICLDRNHQVASRAGTPGFRAPEVLMKYPKQTTALDVWSVGVTVLSLLSSCYPFFKASDDLESLAEVTTLIGTSAMKKAAAKMEKLFTSSEEKPPIDLAKLCTLLRSEELPNQEQDKLTEQCKGCLQPNLCICNVKPNVIMSLSINEQIEKIKKPNPKVSKSNEKSTPDKIKCNLDYPLSVYHLLSKLLDPDPHSRITAEQALNHPFFKNST